MAGVVDLIHKPLEGCSSPVEAERHGLKLEVLVPAVLVTCPALVLGRRQIALTFLKLMQNQTVPLFFDEANLFNEKTDESLHSLKDSRSTLRSL